jgi:hypothetical protein
MKPQALILALAASAGLTGTAHADQCEWNEPDIADRAQRLLAQHPRVLAMCEPCGDTVPGVPFEARKVTLNTPQPGYREVRIDGQAIDLAYTYVQTGPDRFENLAALAGCEAHGVTRRLHIASENPTGVLITSEPAPVVMRLGPDPAPPEPPPPPPPPAPPAEPPPPAATAPSMTISVTAHAPSALPWLAVLFASLTGFFFGAAMTAVRRRRTLRPRAADLSTDR